MFSKKYVKQFCLFLARVLIASSFVYAGDASTLHPHRTQEEWMALKDGDIYIQEIDDLVHEYNITIKNNWNKFEYGKTSTDISDSYYQSADSFLSQASSATDEANVAMAEAKAYGLQVLGDNNLEDSDTNFLNYTKIEKEKSLAVKKIFVNHFINYLNYEIANKRFIEAKKAYESGQRNYNVGNITLVELLALEKNVYTLESTLLTSKINYETNYKNLLIEIGFPVYSTPSIMIPEIPTWEDIAKIDLASDVKKALENNYQLQIYNRKKSNAVTTEFINEQQNNIDSATYYINYDINNKYNLLRNQYNVMLAKVKECEAMNLELAKNTKEFEEGKISIRAYETLKTNNEITNHESVIECYNLVIKKLDYDAAVLGIASTN